MYEHLRTNQIETHMYASQWFLTIFTAKFSLSVIFQIMDIYLCEVSKGRGRGRGGGGGGGGSGTGTGREGRMELKDRGRE